MTMQRLETFVGDALDNQRFSAFHFRVVAIIIAGVFLDLMDIVILGSFAPEMIKSGFATPTQIGVVASSAFLGLLIGSIVQGELTDRFGRKIVYQANLLLYGVATLAAAAAPDYTWLAIFRFIAGLGLGAEIPLAYAYASEFAPKRSRGAILAALNLIGGNLAVTLSFVFALLAMGTLGWRGIFVVIGLSALVVFMLRFGLPESPRWLAARGRGDEALAVLRSLGVRDIPAKLDSTIDPSVKISDPILLIFRHYRRRALALMLAMFSAYGTYYAIATWLPTLMGQGGFTITKSLLFTLTISVSFPVGSLVLMLWADRFGRVRLGIAAFALAAIFALIFRSSSSDEMLLVTGFIMGLFVAVATGCVTIMCGELFPTNARSAGSGLGFAAGRAGATLMAYLVPVVLAAEGVGGVYVLIGMILCLGAIGLLLLDIEPARLSLDEIAGTQLDQNETLNSGRLPISSPRPSSKNLS